MYIIVKHITILNESDFGHVKIIFKHRVVFDNDI